MNAIRELLGLSEMEATEWGVRAGFVRSCDFVVGFELHHGWWVMADAGALMRGDDMAMRPLPDCPTCAAFIDLALSIRAEESQERINAELDAERRKTA